MVEKRFDAVVGNPPYQIKTGRGVSMDIFPDFQKIVKFFSPMSAMIYPATWQKTIVSGLGEYLLKSGMVSSDYYKGHYVFGKAMKKDYPISVVFTQDEYSADVRINGNFIERDLLSAWIDTAGKRILVKKTASYKKLSGVSTLVNVSNADSSPFKIYGNADNLKNPVSIYIKQSAGTQVDSRVMYCEHSDYAKYYGNLSSDAVESYKVAIPAYIVGRMRHFQELIERKGCVDSMVFDKKELFSNTKLLVRKFDTAKEAENFSNYLNSHFSTLLVSLDYSKKCFASFVPDLEDYTDSNPLFTPDDMLPENHEYIGLSLDERLCRYFDLTDEEIEIVENNNGQ